MIDLKEVDMGHFRVDKSLRLPQFKSITVLLLDFWTVNESFCFHFYN